MQKVRLPNKEALFFALSLVGCVAIFAVPDVAHAQSAWNPLNWPALLGDKTAMGFVEAGKFLLLWPYEFLIIPLLGLLVALSGMMFDAAVLFSINSKHIADLSPAINFSWSLIRDFCNMLFIFIMIYISIATILRSSRFDTKRMLAKVIVAALLINFSLFFTKIFVDVGNVFGHWLYRGIQQSLVVASNNPDQEAANINISRVVAEKLGLYGIWKNGETKALLSQSNGFIIVFLKMTAASVLIWVFFYAAILFLARFITLIFLMVFSPIGFIGGLLPQLEPYAKKWKDELSKTIIFPIAFLLMLFLSVQFVDRLLQTAEVVAPGVFGPSADEYGLYLQFILVIMLFYASLKVAKDNSGAIGGAFKGIASSLGGMLVGVGVGAVTGGTSMALRATAGRAGAVLAESKTVQGMVGSESKTARMFGTALRGAGKWTSKQSFDAGKLASKGLGKLDVEARIPKFMQGKGYEAAQKEQRKRAEETIKFLDAKADDRETLKKGRDKAREELKSAFDAEQEDIREALKQTRGDIKKANEKGDTAQASLLNTKKTALENELKAKEDIYKKSVEQEIDKRLALERVTNKELDSAMKAVEAGKGRVEKYVEGVKQGSIIEKSVAFAGTQAATLPLSVATEIAGLGTTMAGFMASKFGVLKSVKKAGERTMEAGGAMRRAANKTFVFIPKMISEADQEFGDKLKKDWQKGKMNKGEKQKEILDALAKEIKDGGGEEKPKESKPEGGGEGK